MTRLPPIDKAGPQTDTRPPTQRSTSYMDIRIEKHWNDAIIPRRTTSRTATPVGEVSAASVSQKVDELLAAPSKLSPTQHTSLCDRVKQDFNVEKLNLEQRVELHEALSESTTEARRKAIVEFIKSHDGVVRWASPLRSLSDSRT